MRRRRTLNHRFSILNIYFCGDPNRFGLKMKLLSYVENGLERIIDGFYAIWPQPFPGIERLKQCKIISHRGEHDNLAVLENTFEAFDKACDAGVWGLEFDVRWTKDLHPVVVHDADLNRVFKIDLTVGDVELEGLRSRCPQIPLLSEVIQKYGRKFHLMVEIKAEAYPDPEGQNQILQGCFETLTPQADYHLISLTPELFDIINFVPESTFMPIAMWNMSRFSQLALKRNMRGIAGHYFLLNDSILSRHLANGQKAGTGYPRSKNCLFREINRGVEWIFSNNAVELQAIVRRYLETDN
jgi:glycerophosphoryl diester phosphodiesterase